MELTIRQKTAMTAYGWSLEFARMPEQGKRLVWSLGATIAVLLVAVALLIGLLLRSDAEQGATPTTRERDPASTSTTTRSTTPTTDGGAPTSGPVATIRTRHGPVAATDVTMQEGIIERQYLLYRPERASEDRRLPVVVALHGLGADRYAMASSAPWAEAVAEDGFVAVFPQGVLNSWNLGPCCPPASLAGVDDIGFLGRVLDEVRGRPDVDPSRLYLTGFSNGGMMAIQLACERSNDVIAVAPVAATNVTGCSPSRPMSLLQLHGDPDDTVPYDGSPSLSQVLSSEPFPAVPASAAAWAHDSSCTAGPERTAEDDGVRVDRWTGCPAGIVVELITYPGIGHNWPTKPVDGLDEILGSFGIDK